MAQRLMFGLLLLAAVPSQAEPLPDPTRPAIGVLQGGIAQAGMPQSGPRLQMIKRSGARVSAMIDGEEVSVGSRVGDMRVIRITESEVVLKGKSETDVLRLFADVEKRPASSGAKERDAGASRKAGK